jgi:hypothetical protein
MVLHFSGLLSDAEWGKLSEPQRLDVLRQAIDSVWGSLVITGQELASRVERARQDLSGDLDRATQRIKALEDHIDAQGRPKP